MKEKIVFTIEKNVAIPPKTTRWRPSKYPFNLMEPGDSFHFDGSGTAIRSAVAVYAARTNTKFATRQDGTGWRVWRTA